MKVTKAVFLTLLVFSITACDPDSNVFGNINRMFQSSGSGSGRFSRYLYELNVGVSTTFVLIVGLACHVIRRPLPECSGKGGFCFHISADDWSSIRIAGITKGVSCCTINRCPGNSYIYIFYGFCYNRRFQSSIGETAADEE